MKRVILTTAVAAITVCGFTRPAAADDWSKPFKDAGGRASDGLKELGKRADQGKNDLGRDIRGVRDQAVDQAEKYRRQAQEAIDRFNQLRRDADTLMSEYQKYERLAKGDDARLRAEAYRQLQNMGVMGSNQRDVQANMTRGLALVIWSSHFDHFEEQKFAVALGESVASGNPGPALAYVKQFAAESKKTVLDNLKNAPQQVRRKVETEFEKMLVEALDKAVNKGQPLELRFEGVSLSVGLATYNHWCDIRFKWPELVPTRQVLGVQLYEIRMKDGGGRIPLPNTYQPYARVQVKYSSR